jgi:hypothetical protein
MDAGQIVGGACLATFGAWLIVSIARMRSDRDLTRLVYANPFIRHKVVREP